MLCAGFATYLTEERYRWVLQVGVVVRSGVGAEYVLRALFESETVGAVAA